MPRSQCNCCAMLGAFTLSHNISFKGPLRLIGPRRRALRQCVLRTERSRTQTCSRKHMWWSSSGRETMARLLRSKCWPSRAVRWGMNPCMPRLSHGCCAGMSTFASKLRSRNVVVHTDNTIAEHGLRKGRARAFDHACVVHSIW